MATAANAADEAVLEAMGFNAFARDIAEAVHDMAALDADEAVLEALGFNAFARELGEAVHDMAALDADDEAALGALGAFAHQLPAGIVIRDLEEEAADTDEEAAVDDDSGLDDFEIDEEAIIEDIIEAADDEEGPAMNTMEFDAFARGLHIRARDDKVVFMDDLCYYKISCAIDRALEGQREEASAEAAAMPRHVACC